jgi:hypothetical protein
MGVIVVGAGSGVGVDSGVAAAAPMHVANKPIPYGALGHYRYGGFTGIIAAGLAANSEIFQFRWTDATRICLILKVKISAVVSTTFFAAGVPVQIDLVKATSWTVAGSGGTRPTITTLMKSRASMGSSLVASSDIGIATTAALTAGTKTLEATSMHAIVAPGPITASLNGQIIAPGTVMIEPDQADGEHPLTLVTNEGFVIRSVAVPATGTWTAAVSVVWCEVTAF